MKGIHTQEPGGERNFSSNNTILAAALAAMGIQFDTRPSSIVVGDGIAGSHRVTYYFHGASDCGRYQTAELIKAWEDRTWHEKHPEHPFAYIKVAFENHSRLIDHIKQESPLGLVRRGRKIGLITMGASSKLQDQVFRRLERGRR